MLIAVVSCASKQGRKRDVSEVYQAQGWSKGADGYNYDIPKVGLPDLKIAADPVEEQCPDGGSGSFCCINGKENEYCCENDVENNQYCCENGGKNHNFKIIRLFSRRLQSKLFSEESFVINSFNSLKIQLTTNTVVPMEVYKSQFLINKSFIFSSS